MVSRGPLESPDPHRETRKVTLSVVPSAFKVVDGSTGVGVPCEHRSRVRLSDFCLRPVFLV